MEERFLTVRLPKKRSDRRFPPPWSVEELDAAFVVIYIEEEPGPRISGEAAHEG
jgi:hypothetical protein